MKYYTIYKTICLLNNKKYIGKHITEDLNDGYLGSGLILSNAIKKYGRENFIKEILFIFDNEEEMNQKEIELINEEVVKGDEYYNIAYGGQGGAIVLKPGHQLYDEVCKKISDAALNRSESIRRIVKDLHVQKRCGMYGKKQSEHQKDAVSKALTGRAHSDEHRKNHYTSLMRTLKDPNYIHPNKGKPKPKKECEYCHKTIDNGNYKKYHGERCKLKYEDYVQPHST
jgi:group I intron endonuclease